MVAPEVAYVVVGILLFTLCVAHGFYCARCMNKRQKNKVEEEEEEDFSIPSKRSLPQTPGGLISQTPTTDVVTPRTPTSEYVPVGGVYQYRQPMYAGETPTGDPTMRPRPRRLNMDEA